ncbi:hypothetical protein [Tianweitania sediminis]|nr:hypothetical protein [Tianweitania sediminis]
MADRPAVCLFAEQPSRSETEIFEQALQPMIGLVVDHARLDFCDA